MGNILRGVVNSEQRRRIKIMRVDGTVFKLSAPVNVKEIEGSHPNHGVFEADVVRRLGVLSRPLPESSELRRARLYFLIPLPQQPKRFSRAASDKLPTAVSILCRGAFSGRDITKLEFDRRVQIVSSADDGSSLRVKFRARKHELANFLSADGNYLLEELVVPMIKQVIDNKAEDLIYRPPRILWKTSLESIADLKSPTRDVFLHFYY